MARANTNKLTDKQERFVQELLKGKSQRVAYRIAYPKSLKWKDESVDQVASRLIKSVKVISRYEKLKSKLISRSESRAIMTAEEIIQGIASIAKDDISNYLDFYEDNHIVGHDDEGKPIIQRRTVIDIKDSRNIDTKNISEISVGKDGTFKFKTYCKDKALYKLADIFGLDELQKAKQKLAEDRFEHEKKKDDEKNW